MKTLLVDAWNTFVLEDGINEALHELLEKYPNKKIVVTNANSEEIKKLGMTDLPYELFTLSHNPDKTDPLYFKKLCEKYGLQADELVYFEHNPQAVESARSLGIESYHYDHTKKDLNTLENFLEETLGEDAPKLV